MIRIKVREIVEAKGWDATILAVEAKIGVATAYRLLRDEEYDENGDVKGGPSIIVLKRVAKALGLKLTDLIDEDWLARLIATGSSDTTNRAEVEPKGMLDTYPMVQP